MEENESKFFDQAKKTLKKVGKFIAKMLLALALKILPYILIALLITTLIAGIIEIVVIHNGSYRAGKKGNVPSTIEKVIQEKLGENLPIKEDDEGYDFDMPELVDTIIKKLEDDESVLHTYITKENQQEYLTNFLKAELVTQNFKIGDADPKKQDEFNGVITVNRRTVANSNIGTTDDATIELEYMNYEDFHSLVVSGDKTALFKYSVNSDGQLVVAQYVEIITEVTSDVPGISSGSDYEFTLNEVYIDYKDMLDGFVMPFDFLWALLVKSTEEEFVNEVAKLALDSEITLTVFDNLTTTVETTVETYEITITDTYLDEETGDYVTDVSKEDRTVTTVVTTNTDTVEVVPTYADVWFAKYSIEYTQEIQGLTQTGETNTVLETDSKVEATNDPNTTREKKSTNYTMAMGSKRYKEGTPVIEEKTDPNSTEDNFVTLLNKPEFRNAKSKIMSTTSWLFKMLGNSRKTVDMIDLIKYLLYKATDEDFGVQQLDQRLFEFETTSPANGSIGWNWTCLHENAAVWLYRNKEGTAYTENTAKYISQDQTLYYMTDDGTSNGTMNYGYGVNIQPCKNYFQQYGINVDDSKYHNFGTSTMPVDIVDNVSRDVWEARRAEVIKTINDMGYSENDFMSYQIDCLTDIRYQGYFISSIVKSYMENGGPCDAVFNSSRAFQGNRGYDRRILFSEGRYILSYNKSISMELHPEDFAGSANFDVDTVSADGYNYPHYLQKDYPGPYGTSTIPRSGCGPTSLAMILAGLKGDSSITPTTVVANIARYWPDGSYYVPGEGSSSKIFGSDFLKKYYGVTSKACTESEALQALEKGYPVIGGESRTHISNCSSTKSIQKSRI